MKNLYKKAIEAHNLMLELHIDTKTSDAIFHKESEKFYEILFQVAHKIGEKHVDLGNNITSLKLQEKKDKANKLIIEIKEDIEKFKENNEITLGAEDLMGSLVNSLENIEGDSKSFLK